MRKAYLKVLRTPECAVMIEEFYDASVRLEMGTWKEVISRCDQFSLGVIRVRRSGPSLAEGYK